MIGSKVSRRRAVPSSRTPYVMPSFSYAKSRKSRPLLGPGGPGSGISNAQNLPGTLSFDVTGFQFLSAGNFFGSKPMTPLVASSYMSFGASRSAPCADFGGFGFAGSPV